MGQVSLLWLCNRDIVKVERDVRYIPVFRPTRVAGISPSARILYCSVICLSVFRIPGVASKFWGIPSVISPRLPHFFLTSVACFLGDRCGTLETAFDVRVTA